MANQRTDTQAVVNLVINGQQAMTSLKELTDTQRRLNTEMRNMRPNDPGYRERLREIQLVNRAIQEQRAEMNGLNTEAEKFKLSWKSIAAGVAGGMGISAGFDMITSAVGKIKDAYAEAEKNRAVLTNALKGDSKMANEALKMLMDFAAKTPFGLQEATDGYLKLVNRGIVPTKEELVKLGDVAASQGKSMDQYIEAILDAQTGENERLKELGIRATKNGDTVSFAFKGITKEVKNSESAIYDALIGFGAMDGVAGTMDVVSKTVTGLASNIEDSWDQIFTKIGQSSEGFIKGFYSTYANLLGYINDELLSTDTAAQKLTNAFKDQANEVYNLEKNIVPLIARHDELKSKGKLNKDEQTELNNIINQVALSIPGAITQWDKYGNALAMNTTKVKEFVEVQKALLKAQNKEALEEARKELDTYTKVRDKYVRDLNKGQTETITQGGYVFVSKNSDEQINKMREEIRKYNDLIEERRLLIKGLSGDYMDEITRPKAGKTAPVSTARTESVIEKEIKELKELRKEQDIHSKSYAEYTAKIKKLQDELAGAQGKATPASKAADKLKKEEEKLSEVIKKMQADFEVKDNTGLEKKLAEINKKYDPVIKKAKELKDAVSESLLTDMKGKEINTAEKNQMSTDLKEFDETEEKDFNEGAKYLNDIFANGKEKNNTEYAVGIAGANTEEQQLLLKEAAQQKERELTEEHLIAQKSLYESYGKETTDIDSKLTQLRIENAEREAQGKIAATEAKRQIDAAYLESAQGATQALMGMVNQQSIAYKGLLVADKAFAIAKIIMNTQAEISGYYSQYSWMPGGVLIASALAAAARVRQGISIGVVAATGIAELAKSSSKPKDSGNAHAKGVRNVTAGTAMVGENGDEIIEYDGKWWMTNGPQIADLPQGANVYNATETKRMLSNKTLGEQLYPPLNYSIANENAREAERVYRSGYSSAKTSSTQTSTNYNQSAPVVNINNKELLEEFKEMKQILEKGLIFNYSTFETFKAEVDATRDSQTG